MEFVLCPRKEKQKSAPMVLSVSCLPGGVIWILDDARLSPTENFKVWTRNCPIPTADADATQTGQYRRVWRVAV